jgi:hypothetical protein
VTERTCTKDGCDRDHYARGLCNTHWKAQRRAAGVDATRSRYAEQRTCDLCNDTYTADRPESMYCSRDCRDLANLNAGQQATASAAGIAARSLSTSITYGHCIACDKLWCGPAGGQPRFYCTKACRSRHRGTGYRRHAAMIHERDNWTCWLCDQPTSRNYSSTDPDAPTLDHLVPRSLGGTNEPNNLATAHALCNATRGARIAITTLTHA